MIHFLSSFLGVLAGVLFSTFVAYAWTGPTSAPPGGNVAAPINTGTTDQVKDAALGVTGLAVFGNSLIQENAYLNWGSTSGANGYGVRDNSGTLEFKNNGGTWSSLQSIVYNLAGSTGLKNIQAFTTSSLYTPTSGAQKALVFCVGGGAGGTPVNSTWGLGGGAGELAIGMFPAIETSVTIGAGGGSAANGGTTSFGSMTAVGGRADAGSNGGLGGSGGTGGAFHVPGGDGSTGSGWACGAGGASFFGGGACRIGTYPANRTYGAGGGGSAANYGYSGGPGAGGVCIVVEF